jgi:hypothetical protein
MICNGCAISPFVVICNQLLIALPSALATFASMNSKHAKTLKAIFAKPVSSNIKFADIEAMVLGLGGEVREGEGSRVALLLNGGVKHAHRPHPGKEAKQYQIKEIKEWLTAIGVKA